MKTLTTLPPDTQEQVKRQNHMSDLIYFSRAELEALKKDCQNEASKLAFGSIRQHKLDAQTRILSDLLQSGKDCEEIWNEGWSNGMSAAQGSKHPFNDYQQFIESLKK